jgi:bisphosphoglycerate-dependent phosphoglycerate mutase
MHHQILNEMVEHLDIPVEKSDAAKRKYSKLHAALVKAMTREKTLLENAKALKRHLDVSPTSHLTHNRPFPSSHASPHHSISTPAEGKR